MTAIQDGSAQVLADICIEYKRTLREQPHFNSSHEGCAFIREEFEELWDCVKTNQPPYAIHHEAIQTAAAVLKFLLSMPIWRD